MSKIKLRKVHLDYRCLNTILPYMYIDVKKIRFSSLSRI